MEKKSSSEKQRTQWKNLYYGKSANHTERKKETCYLKGRLIQKKKKGIPEKNQRTIRIEVRKISNYVHKEERSKKVSREKQIIACGGGGGSRDGNKGIIA